MTMASKKSTTATVAQHLEAAKTQLISAVENAINQYERATDLNVAEVHFSQDGSERYMPGITLRTDADKT
jgi:hypothetical protein